MKTRQLMMTVLAAWLTGMEATATDYYISPTGNDAHDGLTKKNAFATLGKAQDMVEAGDVVYILPGTYLVSESEIMGEETAGPYKLIFNLAKSGEAGKPIRYEGVSDANGQRPVFDLSQVHPAGYRVTGFLVSGSYLVLKNFEVTGIQVTLTVHTQSENIRVSGGTRNTFENIACHDGMGIGFYLNKRSAYNLFVNCDGYNNYDPIGGSAVGDTQGGNNDAFGCHVLADCPGNTFIGCRAWNNTDDGYDLISCASPTVFCYSFAYKNGYDADNISRGDGNGFKAGGYGLSAKYITDIAEDAVPMHEVYHCVAAANKANGFYSNHHLGGLYFHDNTSYNNNGYNYSLVNRKGFGADEAYDVNGYGHRLERNLSVVAAGKNKHVTWLVGGDGENTLDGNSFRWDQKGKNGAWQYDNIGTSVFESSKSADILADREADGMLSETTLSYMKQRVALGYGSSFDGYRQAIADMRKVTGAESGGNPTAIATTVAETTADNRLYDLQGRSVKRPGKGVYIRNGKKIIIR